MGIEADQDYQCRGTALWIEMKGNSPLIQINAVFGTKWVNGAWEKIVAPFEMTCGFWPYKADGTPSDFVWKSLQEALGWQGDDLGQLEEIGAKWTDQKGALFQIRTTLEKGYATPKFINKFGVAPKSGARVKEAQKPNPSKWKSFTAKGVGTPQADRGDLQIDDSNIPF